MLFVHFTSGFIEGEAWRIDVHSLAVELGLATAAELEHISMVRLPVRCLLVCGLVLTECPFDRWSRISTGRAQSQCFDETSIRWRQL